MVNPTRNAFIREVQTLTLLFDQAPDVFSDTPEASLAEWTTMGGVEGEYLGVYRDMLNNISYRIAPGVFRRLNFSEVIITTRNSR